MIAVSARTHARETGGNTRYIRQVVHGLREAGAPIDLLSPPRSADGSSLGWARYEAFEMVRAAERRGARFVWYPADTGPVRQTRRVRTVLTLHGVGALHEPSIRKPVAGRIWLERARRAARVADTIITVSRSSADDIVALAGASVRSRIEVIPHGVSDFWFGGDDAAADERCIRELGVTEPYVFYYGNIEPRKNLPLALDAIEQLRREHPELGFVVAGKPAWESDAILAELHARPWVQYVGRRTDEEIRALLHRSAFFLFPSRYEGFGLPVLEAMAAGTPVVCSTRGSLGEVAGDACFTFDDLEAGRVAEAGAAALAVDRAAQAERARTHARRFTWESSYAAHRALFDV